MKRFGLPLTFMLLIVSVSVVSSVLVLPLQAARGTVLLSVDFTGKTLPTGWILQGSASFIGGLNQSSGAGGLQLTSGSNMEGAAIYGSPFTDENVIIEFSGMYEPNPNDLGHREAEDMGVGFYSGGPTSSYSGLNPASPNGYYAAYEFYWAWTQALMYNGNALRSNVPSGAKLPSNGRNYLFAETIVTSSSISMNALATTSGPWMQEPSMSLGNLLTYSGTVDNSNSLLYVAGASCSGSNCSSGSSVQYVYWLRVVAYTAPPSSSTSAAQTGSSSQTQITQPPITQYVTQTVTSTQPPVTQTVTQTQNTPPSGLSLMGVTSGVIMYAAIGIVVVVLVGVILALRRRRSKQTMSPSPVAAISPPKSVREISPDTAEKLQRLRRMLDLGLITQEDYEDQRRRLGSG